MDDWNAVGTFELVNPKEIVVDHRYQRAEKDNLISEIAKAPNWEAFGAVSCYRRDGVLVCIDGQQRLRGVLTSEEPPQLVPAIIFEKTSLSNEAMTFVKVNITRTSVTSLEKHRALVVANHPAALAVERAVAHVGFSVQGSTNERTGGRAISAISSIYHVYNTLGEEGLVQVLTQIRDAWPDDHVGLSLNIIRGVCDVLVDQGAEYHRGKLTAALATTSPYLILRKAEEFKFQYAGSKQTNVRRAIKELCKV